MGGLSEFQHELLSQTGLHKEQSEHLVTSSKSLQLFREFGRISGLQSIR